MAGRIFISYRRADASGQAGRLHDALAQTFGAERVFMDVDSIGLGLDFVTEIERNLDETAVVLVVMGRQWVSLCGPNGGRRVDDPHDFVRLEVERALARPDVRVVPIRVDGASMPHGDELPEPLRPLTRRNGPELRHDRWRTDVEHLIDELKRILTPTPSTPEPPSKHDPSESPYPADEVETPRFAPPAREKSAHLSKPWLARAAISLVLAVAVLVCLRVFVRYLEYVPERSAEETPVSPPPGANALANRSQADSPIAGSTTLYGPFTGPLHSGQSSAGVPTGTSDRPSPPPPTSTPPTPTTQSSTAPASPPALAVDPMNSGQNKLPAEKAGQGRIAGERAAAEAREREKRVQTEQRIAKERAAAEAKEREEKVQAEERLAARDKLLALLEGRYTKPERTSGTMTQKCDLDIYDGGYPKHEPFVRYTATNEISFSSGRTSGTVVFGGGTSIDIQQTSGGLELSGTFELQIMRTRDGELQDGQGPEFSTPFRLIVSSASKRAVLTLTSSDPVASLCAISPFEYAGPLPVR